MRQSIEIKQYEMKEWRKEGGMKLYFHTQLEKKWSVLLYVIVKTGEEVVHAKKFFFPKDL